MDLEEYLKKEENTEVDKSITNRNQLVKFVRAAEEINDNLTQSLLMVIAGFSDEDKRDYMAQALVDEYIDKGIFTNLDREAILDEWSKKIKDFIEKSMASVRAGIEQTPGGYVLNTVSKGGKVIRKELADFVLFNIRKTITKDNNHRMIVDAIYKGVTSYNIILTGEDRSSIKDFRRKIKEKADGNLSMTITPDEFDQFKNYIESLPFQQVISIPYTGYHRSNGVPFMSYIDKVDSELNEQKIVRILNKPGTTINKGVFYEDLDKTISKFKFVRVPDSEWCELARVLLANIPYINNFNHMMAILAWFMATPIKHVFDIKDYDVRFPYLHIAGTPGSGKTTLLSILTKMMGHIYGGSSFSTQFSIISNMSTSNVFFYWIDEYKADTKKKREASAALMDILRKGSNAGVEERGQKDLSRTIIRLETPVVISGESEFTDAATLERTIQIILSSEDMDSKYKGNPNYKAIKDIRNLERFALNYHEWVLSKFGMWEPWILEAEAMVKKFDHLELRDRDQKKGIAIAVGLLMLEELSRHLELENNFYTRETTISVLEALYNYNKKRSSEDSLESKLIEFLSERWVDGMSAGMGAVDSTTSVRVDKANDQIIFRQAPWIQHFRKYCYTSDLGPQPENIIKRVLAELHKKGCVKEYSVNKSISGKNGKCFVVLISKAQELYDIDPSLWSSGEVTINGDTITLIT